MSFEQQSPIKRIRFWNRKKLPLILQSQSAECGLACLAMVASYYGFQTDMLSLRKRFNLSFDGISLLELRGIAEQLHLTTRPIRIELDRLKKLKTPCILHWNLNHFVVLKAASNKGIVVHDPACGEIRYSLEEASKFFTGVALELMPTQEFSRKEKEPSLRFSDFWSRIIGLKSSLLLIVTLSVLLQVFVLASPYYIQLVVDDVILSSDTSLLIILAIGFGLVLLFEILTNALRGLTLLHFSNFMSVQLGSNLFHHLIRLPLEYFEKRHMGDIVSRFGSLQRVKELLTTGVIETFIDGIMALITLVMIFFYSPMLSVVVLAAVFLYALMRLLMYKPYRRIKEQEIVALADENTNFMETVRAIQAIKLFGTEVQREGQWQNHYSDTINQNIKLGQFQISYTAINRFLFGFENIVVIYLAATLVIKGGFSTGMLFAFMAYKLLFMDKMASLIDKLIEFKMLNLHFERLADIALSNKEELRAERNQKHYIKGKISISSLSFSYSSLAPNVIENLNLEIQEGESVAITGPSGSGKSTLVKLMLGLLKPAKGDILIDGVPIHLIGNSQYRQQIAAVMQNDELLSGSIADNIAFFDSAIDMDWVVHCAVQAEIHDDISQMSMGYDTFIGDMGSSLSGGQKQRIILARALYKKPKILFMDEATSHLDDKLESSINQAIKEMDITRVVIAHRKETIASTDREIKLS